MKCYVQSGEIKAMVGGPHIEDEETAACEVMLKHMTEGKSAAPLIIVSQRGFEFQNHGPEEDTVFATQDILKKAGFIFEEGNEDDTEC